MRLYQVKKRTPELDTKVCICVNNRLWNRDKIQFINGGKEFLVPKLYRGAHIAQIRHSKLIKAKSPTMNPLRRLKQVKPPKRKPPKYKPPKEPRYNFYANYLTKEQYEMLYGFYYSKIKPNGKRTIKTIEQIEEYKRNKRKNEK